MSQELVETSVGEVLLESSPLVHVVSQRFRSKCCHNCFKFEISTTCEECHIISYCSLECLAEDRSDHKLECSFMEELEELPDITRITARLLLKLEEGGLDQSEPLPFSLGERSFESLLSHAEKIDDEDLCARQVFESLTKLMSSATGSWSHFKQVYGKLIINSFEISDEDDDRLGWALYLAPSILDHSCVPSAEVTFKGKNIVVKSKVTMRPRDLSKMTVSFIDRTKPFTCTEFKLLGERIMSEVRGHPGGPSTSVMKTVEQEAAGKQRHYFRSVRCSKCSGWPVKIGHQFEPAKCGYCDEQVDGETLDKYFKIKREIINCIRDKTSISALRYVHLMLTVFHPTDLTFIFMCQMALVESLNSSDTQSAGIMANILYQVLSKSVPKCGVDH